MFISLTLSAVCLSVTPAHRSGLPGYPVPRLGARMGWPWPFSPGGCPSARPLCSAAGSEGVGAGPVWPLGLEFLLPTPGRALKSCKHEAAGISCGSSARVRGAQRLTGSIRGEIPNSCSSFCFSVFPLLPFSLLIDFCFQLTCERQPILRQQQLKHQ